MTDEELVRAYIETQRNFYFEYLYQRYCDRVYRKCLSFTKDQSKAEDFTHDIFLRLIVRLGSYKEEARFSTWLFSITYNYCTDQLRTNRRRSEVLIDDDEAFLDTNTEDDTQLAEMEASRLINAMSQLTPGEQSLLMMKYQDDLSIRDIAEISSLTESAIKMRLKRAKEKLRKHYMEALVFWLLLLTKLLS